MQHFGFSTGSLAFGDFRLALRMLRNSGTTAVELSALRFAELDSLLSSLDDLDLEPYRHVSVHAPGSFPAREEEHVVEALGGVAARGWHVVLHPNAICDYGPWRHLGSSLLIENMDKRKPIGRNASELARIFAELPFAGLCFDIAHARQVDPSMTEAYAIIKSHGSRIRQIHISEVGSSSSHIRLSRAAVEDFQEVAAMLPRDVAVILETPVGPSEFETELAAARAAITPQESSHKFRPPANTVASHNYGA
jgi:hypothetical protein